MAILSRKGLNVGAIKRIVLNTNMSKLRHLNDYERFLMQYDTVPKSYLLKRASPREVDHAIAEMLSHNQIELLNERTVPGAELLKKLAPDLREGRYVTNKTPDEFREEYPGTRGRLECQILHGDYRYIWDLGKGRLALGLQLALRKAREVRDE